MNALISAITQRGVTDPDRIALECHESALSYGQLDAVIKRLASWLNAADVHAIALLADNSIAWAVADLAALAADITIVPIPAYFSPLQVRHTVSTAGIDLVLTDQVGRVLADLLLDDCEPNPFFERLVALPLHRSQPISLPPDVCKITFTSGTTGTPKGVCLTAHQLLSVANELKAASGAKSTDRHLCLLPLATLLENVAGIYVPLLTGATSCVPSLEDVGLRGSSGFDVVQAITALSWWRATTALTVPQTLNALVCAHRAGIAMPRHLRYLAVGGAPISRHLLEAAQRAGLPVHEGYGLTECGSVVAVNRLGANRVGSVGKPLAHLKVRIASGGEILVEGNRGRGYLGDRLLESHFGEVATGDLGYLDADGYLYVTGRKRDVFITSFGRNVAPEWVEGELLTHPSIVQAFVTGEGRPFNCAVIVASDKATAASIERALEAVNATLPDYAQVRAWIPATEPFSPTNAMLTFNGRLRRETISRTYAQKLDAIYRPSDRQQHRALPGATRA
jgi:long-chain acyl-CoA synthetase